MSKQEKLARLGLAVSLAGCFYLAVHLFPVSVLPIEGPDPDTASTAARLMILFLLAAYFIKRRDASPLADERDRSIEARRANAGYMSLALMIVVCATLGLEGYDVFWRSRSPAWLGSGLMFLMFASLVIHSLVGVVHYWRDRR
ncbi:hypothetical protein AAD027_05630 [Pseudoxanthomonas putridarboris]|uniref:Transmembrane protein n=1 Tax=Pseudoxanthomonas putridarboris TaxID=752605 RepID=A0ABU9IYP6_9GAMM